MLKTPDQLQYFFRTYLLPDTTDGTRRALAAYVAVETEMAVRDLRREAREVLGYSNNDLHQIARLLDPEGLTTLGRADDLRQLAVEVYETLLTIAPELSTRKPVDIFISHSSRDRQFATSLAAALRDRGFVVWLDQWNILVGHSIVDEVYGGIARSNFLAVILSQASLRSEWVKRELSAALIREIEDRATVVLPILKEECQIPQPLRGRRYANFVASWEAGFEELVSAMRLHQIQSPAEGQPVEISRDVTADVADLESQLEQRARDAGFLPDDPIKGVYVIPMAAPGPKFARTQLERIVDSCRVEISRWGGPSFPYERGSKAEVIREGNGVLLMDHQPWPYQERSAHIWRFNVDGKFGSRSLLEEDLVLAEAGNVRPFQRTLSVEWAMLDITRPLLFARNYLVNKPELGAIGVAYRWTGLGGRTLIMMNRRRFWRTGHYTSRVASWSREEVVGTNQDLRSIANRALADLLWQFGVDGPLTEGLSRDVQALLDGRMPD